MSVEAIGNSLVRTSLNSAYGRRYVLDKIQGKTLIRVFAGSKLIEERIKSIEPRILVGDKFVKRIVKIDKLNDLPIRPKKTIVDRVYSLRKKFVGTRIEKGEIYNDGTYSKQTVEKIVKLYTKKGQPSIKKTMKHFRPYNPWGTGLLEERDVAVDGSYYFAKSASCNFKGLPYPRGIERGVLSTSSLKDMRLWFQENYPGTSYLAKEFRMQSLDEPLLEQNSDLLKYL